MLEGGAVVRPVVLAGALAPPAGRLDGPLAGPAERAAAPVLLALAPLPAEPGAGTRRLVGLSATVPR